MKKKQKSVPPPQPEPCSSEPCITKSKMTAEWTHEVTKDRYSSSLDIAVTEGELAIVTARSDVGYSGYLSGCSDHDLRCMAQKLNAAADQMVLWRAS